MTVKKSSKCLMIKTKDERQLFTHIRNYNQLIEFSKLFNAEISVVKTKDVEILELAELAPALCDKTYKMKADYELLEVRIKQKRKLRQNILQNAIKIRDHIRDQFLAGKIVSLKELKKTFKGKKLTTACLCNHVRMVKEKLEKDGYEIIKIGGGKYKMV